MFFKPKNANGGWVPGSADVRALKRTRCTGRYCNLGSIVDLTPSGVGLLTQATHLQPGLQEVVRLDTESGSIAIGAEVKWALPRPDGLYRAGLRFTDRSHAEMLKALCRVLRDEDLDSRGW
ncbi:MAG: PilZ domain-containing protein [Phycisphaeraceae bacterium]|nr:MAG: PilZ domain-containing protein [Phycisphaeraceae bacterium]